MEYLLTLQNIRESCPGFVAILFSIISEAVCYVGPVVPIVLYFCLDKKLGARVMFVFMSSDTICNVVKLGACIPRPWVRDSRLHMAGAEYTSSGYSFPSAHTAAATSIYGSTAQWLKTKKATIICILLTLLTAFARTFLGMHTLTDVVFAIVETVLIGFVAQFIFKDIEKHPERDVLVLVIGLILCGAACLYLGLKSYPLDTFSDGTYIYQKMQKDGYASLGMMMAWLICWFVERRFINFSTDGTAKEKVIRAAIGVAIFCLFFFVITKLAFLKADPRVYYFFKRFISIVASCGVYPYFIKKHRK